MLETINKEMASEIFSHIRKKGTAALKDMLGLGTCYKDVKYQGSFSRYRAALQALKSQKSINKREGRVGLPLLSLILFLVSLSLSVCLLVLLALLRTKDAVY